MVTKHHIDAHAMHGGTFGSGGFGSWAEKIARLFGTPQYLLGQSAVVALWIVFNGYSLLVNFDPYPYILLNLAFSLQAAYAAPLILLARRDRRDGTRHSRMPTRNIAKRSARVSDCSWSKTRISRKRSTS